MQIFINETSLCSQYANPHEFSEAVRLFISSVNSIHQLRLTKNVWFCDKLFSYEPLPSLRFDAALKSLYHSFQLNWQQLNPKCWRAEQVHDTDSCYEVSNQNYVNTSIAELAERKMAQGDLKGFLMNFADSTFGESENVDVLKNKKDRVVVDCNFSPASIASWLVDNGFEGPDTGYNENSKFPPTDAQTVLADKSKFEATKRMNNGRTLYRLIGTKQLWCVDRSPRHSGPNAHLEVFDEETEFHLGTSLYNRIDLDARFRVSGRKIG